MNVYVHVYAHGYTQGYTNVFTPAHANVRADLSTTFRAGKVEEAGVASRRAGSSLFAGGGLGL